MPTQVFPGELTFIDQNGDPLSGGKVFMYFPNTSTFSNTWQDEEGTILNTNPIILDQAGRAGIWGVGNYRQVVEDQFGNIQWDRTTSSGASMTVPGQIVGDASISGNAVISGSATVGNGLYVTGGETVTGDISAGTVTANGITAGELQVNGNGNITGTLSVDSSSGSTDLMRGDKIVVTSGNSPGIAFANTADGLTMGWWEASDELRGGVTDGTTGEPVNTFIGIGGTNGGIVRTAGDLSVGGIAGEAHTVVIHSGSSPSFTCHNTADGLAQGMWEGSGVLQWGLTDTAGNPTTSNMRLDTAGNLTILGDFYPGTVLNIGSSAIPWNAMFAHAFNVVSTDFDSALLKGGQLEVVKSIPVKTEPHIGISAREAQAIAGAVEETGIGTNYAVLLGVLWKALQELSAEFDAYVAAHP